MNRKEAWSRNWAIMRLRGMRALKFLNMTIGGKRIEIFTKDECDNLQTIIDAALSRLGAETETARHKRFMQERLSYSESDGKKPVGGFGGR